MTVYQHLPIDLVQILVRRGLWQCSAVCIASPDFHMKFGPGL